MYRPYNGMLPSGAFDGKDLLIVDTTGKKVHGILQRGGAWKVLLSTPAQPHEFIDIACPWGASHQLEIKLCDRQKTLCCEGSCGGIWLAIIEERKGERSYLSYHPKAKEVDSVDDGEISVLDPEQLTRLQIAQEGSTVEARSETVGKINLRNLPSDTPADTSVFIVHGRDDAAKNAVVLFLRDLGFKEIILENQPNSGLTIIEKLEQLANNVRFAIALLTPDDVGALRNEADEDLKLRARQNVILELGYFQGKLERGRVCLLVKGELENPSDLDGLLYIPMKSEDGWKLRLAQEMKSVGLPVDLNKLV